MAFTIVTDTSSNLPSPLLREHGIGVLPLVYTVNGEELTCLDTEAFKDGVGEEYYAAIKSGTRVHTSQVTPQRYIEFFEPILKGGEDLLFVGMSSGISNSYNSSEVAASELRRAYPERKIRTVDTLAASLGEGIAVLHAIELRAKGLTVDETADWLLSMRQSLYQVVLLDDLMHLHRGGRVSAPKALIGTVLGIRPILKGDEGGHLVVCGKTRGRKRGLAVLAEKYEELVDREKDQTVGIAYTDCPEDAYALRDTLAAIWQPREIMVVRYEPVTGSYVGPGTVALFFEGRDGVREK
ncbi:MAG: DegV family protein [Clostridiales bacterium]|nr:DegV family protein [Clostridiales bacterium]